MHLNGKIIFHYGTMNSGKSTLLLQMEHDYSQMKFKTFLYKPRHDKRDGLLISSRLGISKYASLLPEIVYSRYANSIVFIDECQFLSEKQMNIILDLADKQNCVIHCFGLRTNSHGKLFEGSKFLFEVADELNEISRYNFDEHGNKRMFHLDVSGHQNSSGIREGDVGKNDYLVVSRKEFFDKYLKTFVGENHETYRGTSTS